MLPVASPQRLSFAGRYVRLEPLSPEHCVALHAISADPDRERLFRYLPDEPGGTLTDTRAWIEAKLAVADPLFYACVDAATGDVVGRQALMRITPAHGVIEIGNILWGPAMARSRLATEALFLAADYVFGTLGYRRFEWKCDALNAPSRQAALRFGFGFEGIFRQHMWIKGRNRDTAWYAMLDRDWPRLRGAYVRWLEPANFDPDGHQRLSLARLIAGA